MPCVDVVVECPVFDSFRVRQVAGMFDLALPHKCTERFVGAVPDESEDWQIGVIVGPSGTGKSTIARHAFGDRLYTAAAWPADRAVIDSFGDLPIKEITGALTSVGFSSPPGWIKPYAVLSNGEQFRCDLAKALLRQDMMLTVYDEFTSVVDRTVAKVASAAVAKAIRSGRIRKRFVAVTCHYDIVRWLEPDWVLDMAGPILIRGRLRRPGIRLEIERGDSSYWPLFRRHHYLSGELHRSAACFIGRVEDRIATFTAVLPFPHATRPGWREHRTVCLPDFQGVGLGNAASEFVASLYRATGRPYFSTTGHPAMIRHRCRSPLWRVTRRPRSVISPHSSATLALRGSVGRITAGFEYVGIQRTDEARRLGVLAAAG